MVPTLHKIKFSITIQNVYYIAVHIRKLQILFEDYLRIFRFDIIFRFHNIKFSKKKFVSTGTIRIDSRADLN